MPAAARAVAFVTRVARRLSGVGLVRTAAALSFTMVLGIAFVVVTAVLLIATVEREINAIFRVPEPRSLARRALVYGLGVPFAVLAIGAAVHTMRWLIERSLEAATLAAGPVRSSRRGT
jgi:membrane protein